jgi:hypothetical protein
MASVGFAEEKRLWNWPFGLRSASFSTIGQVESFYARDSMNAEPPPLPPAHPLDPEYPYAAVSAPNARERCVFDLLVAGVRKGLGGDRSFFVRYKHSFCAWNWTDSFGKEWLYYFWLVPTHHPAWRLTNMLDPTGI